VEYNKKSILYLVPLDVAFYMLVVFRSVINNEIDIETLDKLFAARTDEFVQHVKDLALANDEELKEKMSFIINADLETF